MTMKPMKLKARNRNQKLTLLDAVHLRRRSTTEHADVLAREFGVSTAFAYAIIRGESHRAHVDVPVTDDIFLALHRVADERRTSVEELATKALSNVDGVA